MALVHRSFVAESVGEEPNERLEFLGDAVLGVVVTSHLYTAFPELREGDLARIKAAVVSTDALAPIAKELGLGAALFLGRGEEMSGGREKPSLLADSLEAVIGAVYLSGGIVAAERFVLSHLGDTIEEAAAQSVLGDPKNVLQERAFQLGLSSPSYRLTERGPEHAKLFLAKVEFGSVIGNGEGKSKKEAERHAARDALVRFDRSGSDQDSGDGAIGAHDHA